MPVAKITNFYLLASVRRLLLWGVLPLLCCLAAQRGTAGLADGAALSQRRINELAACLQRARVALIEDTGLRRPQEPVPAYLDRIALTLPGETYETYHARIQGYVNALATAVTDTASIHGIPALHHDDVANRQLWQRAVKALNLLPLHVKQARIAWRGITREEAVNWQASNSQIVRAPYRRLGSELTQTLELVLAAYNALRDARP